MKLPLAVPMSGAGRLPGNASSTDVGSPVPAPASSRVFTWLFPALGLALGLACALLPLQGLALGLVVAAGAALAAFVFATIAPGAPAWIKGLFFVVAGQTVLNYGFSNLMLKVGGVPITVTEMVLAVALVACLPHGLDSRRELRLPTGLWLLAFWVLFNLAWHLPSGISRFGIGAARDALPSVEMLFVVPGYVAVLIALRSGDTGRVWLTRLVCGIAVSGGFYGLLYPLSETIQRISPKVPSLQQSVPVLGYFVTSPIVGLLSLFGIMLWFWRGPQRVGVTKALVIGVMTASALLVFFMSQGRVNYLFVLLTFFVFLFIGGQSKRALVMAGVVLLGIAALFAIELSGVQVEGRIGRMSASGIIDHVISLQGDSDNADFRGSANGVNQRKQWREYSLGLWARSEETQVLGIGFGQVLTDLTTLGTEGQTLVVREPHNSFVTMLSRSGLVGLAVMLTLHGAMLYAAASGYRRFRSSRRTVASFFLVALLYEIYSLLNAWGQPHFEVAYYAVPSHFLIGAVLAARAYYSPLPDPVLAGEVDVVAVPQ
jgi:O-Antigen ligase